jgi:hypothetical protein
MIETKTCRGCSKSLPIASFYNKPNGQRGYLSRCKACFNEANRARWRKDPDFRAQQSELARARRTARANDPSAAITLKVCVDCQVDKPLTEYYRSSGRVCVSCVQARRRVRRTDPAYRANEVARDKDTKHQKLAAIPEYRASVKRKTRDLKLRKKYGIDLAEYLVMLSNQGFKCAICRGEKPQGMGHGWAVDHDHETGKVRGITCGGCNSAMGHFRDRADLCEAGGAYLRRQRPSGVVCGLDGGGI